MKRSMTCIVCPLGCELEVEIKPGGDIFVGGNTCPRGAEYAKNECTDPVRTVTTTVKCINGSLLPVKTDRPVAKDKVYDVMKIIAGITIPLPIKVGDVIIENVYGSNIVATANME